MTDVYLAEQLSQALKRKNWSKVIEFGETLLRRNPANYFAPVQTVLAYCKYAKLCLGNFKVGDEEG